MSGCYQLLLTCGCWMAERQESRTQRAEAHFAMNVLTSLHCHLLQKITASDKQREREREITALQDQRQHIVMLRLAHMSLLKPRQKLTNSPNAGARSVPACTSSTFQNIPQSFQLHPCHIDLHVNEASLPSTPSQTWSSKHSTF